MMFLQLTKERTYRGRKYQVGASLEVGDALGQKLIAIGAAKKTSQEAYENAIYQNARKETQKKPLSAMNKAELTAEAERLEVDISGVTTNDDIRAAIKKHQEV